MPKIQCPSCKRTFIIPSKIEGQQWTCVLCGELFAAVAIAKTTQQQSQDIKTSHEITESPKPRQAAPAPIIDKVTVNRNVEPTSKLNPSTFTQQASRISAAKNHQDDQVNIIGYSGFWRRVAAHLIDGIVLLPIGLILPALAKGILIESLLAGAYTLVAIPIGFFLSAMTNILLVITYWLYFAKMHSSSKQATLGKMVMGIIVTDTNGNRLSFARASGRQFATFLSAVTLCIGFIMIALTKRNQALHDMITGTVVVKSEMNKSSKPIRSFAKLISIYLSVLLFSTACFYLTYHAKQSRINKLKVEQLEVPSMPPGFESLVELGKFDVSDHTDTAQDIIPTTQLSADWSAEKEYEKPWSQFTDEEKTEFDALMEKIAAKLTHGVQVNGGVFEAKRGRYDACVFGQWEVFHDDKYAHGIYKAPKRWDVRLNTNKTTLELPRIGVYIRHAIISEED